MSLGRLAGAYMSLVATVLASENIYNIDGKNVRSFAAPAAASLRLQCGENGTMVFAVQKTEGVRDKRGDRVILDGEGKEKARVVNQYIDAGVPLGASMNAAVSASRIFYGAGDSSFVTSREIATGKSVRIPLGEMKRTPAEDNRRRCNNCHSTPVCSLMNRVSRCGCRRRLSETRKPYSRSLT